MKKASKTVSPAALRRPTNNTTPPRPRRPPAVASSVADVAAGREIDVLGVLDFECTCEPGWGYVHEIIEFPVVLLDCRTGALTGEVFQSYVRPTENATLSSFCTELTGIAQASVDAAPTLPEVLEALDAWLRARGLVGAADAADGASTSFALATDGWDLRHFLDEECTRKGIAKPAYLDEWCDLSKEFDRRRKLDSEKVAKARGTRRKSSSGKYKRRTNLAAMMRHHGLVFEGRPHSGIDDATNIARVAAAILADRADDPLRVNDRLPVVVPAELAIAA